MVSKKKATALGQALGQGERPLPNPSAVQQQKRLSRRRSHTSLRHVRDVIRHIKRVKHLVRTIPHHAAIHRTTSRLLSHHSGTARLQIQFTGDRQQRVPNLLRTQSPNRRPGQPNIRWIAFGGSGIRRTLPIRRAGYHSALNLFETPTIRHEPGGQPVEQLRVRWTLAQFPKSLVFAAKPRPKYCYHSRFTSTERSADDPAA